MYKRHLLLVACLSLVTGTAAASIPDESGVYHGCYNLLSGSVKLIDGTNCGLLERHVTWQQKGIQGPQGIAGNSVTSAPLNVGDSHCPTGGVALTLAGNTSYVCNGTQGEQGPEGPAAKVFMGTETIVPPFNQFQKYTDAYTQPITAEADGRCIVTLNFVLGFPADPHHPHVYGEAPRDYIPFPDDLVIPSFVARSVYRTDSGGDNVSDRKAVMAGTATRKSASVTDIFELEAGKTYRFGGSYGGEFTNLVLDPNNNYINVFWNCMYY